MELQEFVTQSGDVVNELFNLAEFDRDLPEQPLVSGLLSAEDVLHLIVLHHADPNQKLTDSFRHCSPFPLLSMLSLLPDIAGLLLC